MKKLIYAGTSEFGIPTLEKLKNLFEIVLIITPPNRPSGRKQILTPSPIKVWAEKNLLPVSQPEKITELKDQISDLAPDLMLVVAYGQIIPKQILDIPKFGSVNIHGSILPKYRGASPIQTAILNGDAETGITFIKMDEKMDHGLIVARTKTEILENEDFPALYKRLAKVAAEISEKFLPDYLEGKITLQSQDETRATFTKLFTKADGRIKWTEPAKNIHQMVLALNPEPGTWTLLDQKSVKILKTELLRDNKIELAGKIYRINDGMAVKCSDFSLKITEIQPEGKKPMSGKDYINGLKNLETKIFV